jgi:low affinity Fe/Cu permease
MKIPIYVTRKTGEGQVASYSFESLITIPAMYLAMLNVIVWGIVGLMFGAKEIIGLLV